MTEIYTMGGGDWLREMLNAVATFMQSDTFIYIKGVMLLVSVLCVAYHWLIHHNVMSMLGWVFAIAFVSLFAAIKHPVQIIDNSDLKTVYTVPNVPVGLIIPAGIVSSIGHSLVTGYEAIFAQPDDATYTKTGMLFGANLIAKSTDFLSQNPEVTDLFSDYIQNCVIGDILLNHKYSLEQLMNTRDPYSLIFSRPSPLRGVINREGVFETCQEAAVVLKNKLGLDTKTGGETWHYYARQLFGGRPNPDALFGVLLGNSYQTFYQSGQSASEILKQNVTMNAIHNGILTYSARNGDVAGMMNISSMMALEKQRLAQASAALISPHFLPTLHIILMGIMMGIFPIMLLCALINLLTIQIVKNYLLSFLWLQCWPVLFAILNSAMTFFAKKNGVPVVLSNLSIIKSNQSDIATAAGWLSLLIPFISWGMVKGMGQVFSSVSSSLGSSMLGSTTQAASVAVDGNYAYNNLQTDNVQGYGWSTNSTFASGQMSHQTASGGSATQTMEGNMVYNTTGAMSVLPTNIAIQRSIASAQQEMARNSEAQAQSALQGYNSSISSAASQLSQFTRQAGQSDSLVKGADSSLTSNQSRAAHQMASAVESYAKANNISQSQATQELMERSGRTSLNSGLSGHVKWDSGDMLATKLGKWATGASVGTEIHGGVEGSLSDTDSHSASKHYTGTQDNRHDTSAQAVSDFKQGLDVLTSYRTSDSASHTDNQSDSQVNQLAATLNEAQSQYHQYTDSNTRSHEFAEMASRTESLSGQMSENLTQQFANYVSQHAPQQAEQILTDTNSPEMAAEREALAREFVQQQVTPKIDNAYHENQYALQTKQSTHPSENQAEKIKATFADQAKNIPQQASISNNVRNKVRGSLEDNSEKVNQMLEKIENQQTEINQQKNTLQTDFTKEKITQQKDYTQEKVDQQFFRADDKDSKNLKAIHKQDKKMLFEQKDKKK
ncbi:conjugal transfer protein TraG [Arsenophonus sp. ENCA]|uniref:conjugal transfer mating-pair stabilization protein TraG n=1 Tax=Arsenophonus sp. ENCA TaxID=1987579 RepID=UPI000BD75E71|nr:conjugal transfer mating-pair stabilization protein TraG [Arsenophonus sp. ENCA]PAU99452.1 conjugal transfer protein TraG [Arsenophonus sp. ENCA]